MQSICMTSWARRMQCSITDEVHQFKRSKNAMHTVHHQGSESESDHNFALICFPASSSAKASA